MSTVQDLTIISPWKAELVKDIFPGQSDLSADQLTNFNNTLYFQADQTGSCYYSYSAKEQLWKSDGTEADTNLVKDQGLSSHGSSALKVDNNTLYFQVINLDPSTMTSSLQLWKTDGTDTGVQLVKDLGSYWNIRNFTPIENSLYFTTVGSSYDENQLWKTDGTEAGTTLVKDFGHTISNFREINNVLYLDVNNDKNVLHIDLATINLPSAFQLWKTDGTEAGITLVKDFGDSIFCDTSENNTAIINNTLYFEVNSQYSPEVPVNYQLWQSDGTNTGTTVVKDFGNIRDINKFWGEVNNTFYFSVSVSPSENNNKTTYELWKSDGTNAGTTLVQDLGNYSPDYLTTVNNTLYFLVNKYDSLTKTDNNQLWKIDGNNGNISLIKDVGDLSIEDWETIDNNLYFQISKYDYNTNNISTAQLWKTDGTDVGTTLVKDFPNSSFMGGDELGVINNILYFQLTDSTYGKELWMSNGTETGTMMVADINPGKGSSNPSIPVDVNNTLYLLADDGIHGNELWKLTSTQLGSDVRSLAMSNLKLMSEVISTYQLPNFSNSSNGF
ncbi:ELWxxDGT repeat protein [Planktothrix agardhii]|uniref:Hyalin repeat protein n=1 Tax=Planktothrix agardhii TaxID=1160 RepID=A0AAD1V2N1_PLAAG|nr:ELWxxDGT repeat protein [Planktothrix agardhii]MCB8752004.1 hypothetical protein [Planktothrix agardhii 1810]MCF3607909.1 hypothetical protein [Planktothrix agardhii 1033]CAD5939226.1 hypothetical protein PANO66_01866 [Planktothrix agardhii]